MTGVSFQKEEEKEEQKKKVQVIKFLKNLTRYLSYKTMITGRYIYICQYKNT